MRIATDPWLAINGLSDEPRKRRAPAKQDEDKLHVTVAKYLRTVIGHEGDLSSHGVVWFSTELRAKRSMFEGARNKARGVIAGIPDIMLVCRGQLHCIELKTPTGRVSPDQAGLLVNLHGSGACASVARSLDEVSALIEIWNIPTRVST